MASHTDEMDISCARVRLVPLTRGAAIVKGVPVDADSSRGAVCGHVSVTAAVFLIMYGFQHR
jgi:hypothetical protein